MTYFICMSTGGGTIIDPPSFAALLRKLEEYLNLKTDLQIRDIFGTEIGGIKDGIAWTSE